MVLRSTVCCDKELASTADTGYEQCVAGITNDIPRSSHRVTRYEGVRRGGGEGGREWGTGGLGRERWSCKLKSYGCCLLPRSPCSFIIPLELPCPCRGMQCWKVNVILVFSYVALVRASLSLSVSDVFTVETLSARVCPEEDVMFSPVHHSACRVL